MLPSKSNYYADAGPAETPEPQEPHDEKTEGEGEAQTAELPKTVLGGKDFKPGEEVVLEIVDVRENSVLVKYASEKGGEKEEEAPAAAGAEPAGGNPGYYS